MLLQLCSRVAGWVVVLGVLQLVASAPARACLCIDPPLLWPEADSVVSSNTAIVLRGAVHSVKLLDPDGAELALKRTKHLPHAYGCLRELTFLQPERELEPGLEYTVVITQDGVKPHETKFSAREKTRRPEAAAPPELSYLLVKKHPACDDQLGQCIDLAEIRVEFAQPLDEPAWLVVRSRALQFELNRWEFSTNTWSMPPFGPELTEPQRVGQVSLMLPPDDACVDISIYGIDGQAFFEERLCEPDRCAVFQYRQSSTCGETPHSNLDVSRVPPGSCDAPPVLEYGDGGLNYPHFDVEQDAGPPVRMRTQRASGCHVQPLSAAARPRWPLTLGIAAGLLLLRRRRPQR